MTIGCLQELQSCSELLHWWIHRYASPKRAWTRLLNTKEGCHSR
jgi:hypothetical protein